MNKHNATKKDKVCHMTSVHQSTDVRIFHKECVSLATAGYEVYLVAPGESREEKGVHIVGVGAKPASRLKRMLGMARKIYQAALKLDCEVYHLHDPELLLYGLKLMKFGKKVIFDSHEDILHSFIDKKWLPSLIRKPVANSAVRYFKSILPRFDTLISVTPHLHEELLRINSNTYMITNYPIIESNAAAPVVKKNPSDFTLVFAGGVTSQWSHEEIIQAIQVIDNVKYIAYGKCSDAYLDKLKAHDQKSKFDYKGVVPHETIIGILSSVSVGMALCKYSNNTAWKRGSLGNTKLFEYMLADLPVICTDFELWKEIIDKYRCGICTDPDNTDDIAGAIQFLFGNPDKAREMGLNGRRAVEEEYNWGKEEEKLFRLYKDICG